MTIVESLKLEDGFYIEYQFKNDEKILNEILESNNDFFKFL